MQHGWSKDMGAKVKQRAAVDHCHDATRDTPAEMKLTQLPFLS
jgi:hypothetical protein